MRTIVAWGMGWAGGALILAAAFLVLDPRRTEATTAFLSLAAGAAAFGFPTFVAARSSGSRRPVVQALIWGIAFAAAAIVLAQYHLAGTALASPGDLNINTYETIRERQASFDRWGVAPEVVSSFAFTLSVIIAAAFASGALSALIVAGLSMARLIRAVLFGMLTALVIVAGIALIPLGTYILALVLSAGGLPRALGPLVLPGAFLMAAMGAGCATGALIEHARAHFRPDSAG